MINEFPTSMEAEVVSPSSVVFSVVITPRQNLNSMA